MKKLIIGIGALGIMSFTTNQVIHNYQLAVAINNIQDMKEWMKEDIARDNIITDLGEHYIMWLDETEDLLIDLHEQNTIK